MKKVTFEHEEENVSHAVASEVAEELDRAQKDQDRPQDELGFGQCFQGIFELLGHPRSSYEAASAKLSSAFKKVSNRRATHEAICAEVRKACPQTQSLGGSREHDLSQRAYEAHDK